MNSTDNQTRECDPMGVYGPEQPLAMLRVDVVHCYCVMVLGTLGNALALWCVATCTKMRRPVKVLMFSVFVPVLVVCVVFMPVLIEYLNAIITCDPNSISKKVAFISIVMYHTLATVELASIAAVAVVRAVSVWAPQRQTLGLRGAVLLVPALCLFAILPGIFVALAYSEKDGSEIVQTLATVFTFFCTTLPILITSGAYICMIFIIQRNKRRLAGSVQQGQGGATTMDPVTRALLAVFISTLVFSLPTSIFRLTGKQPLYMHIIFGILFNTQFMVDPLAMVLFNRSFRSRVISQLKKVTQSLSCPQHHFSSTPAPSSRATTATTSRRLSDHFEHTHTGEPLNANTLNTESTVC